MNGYLDVAVVQIQTYLTRAPSLRGRRGASTMVTEATATEATDGIANLLAGRATLNPETGKVDGVVSLLLTDRADASRLADDVLAHLRRKLPAASLVAKYYEGDTYTRSRRAVMWEREWLAAVAEWPLAKPCDWCRSWPAGPDKVQNDYQDGRPSRAEKHCVDCARRGTNAGYATSGHAVPGTERRLLELIPGRTVPDTFVELAEMALGQVRDDTHLATVYADGNAIGDYMKRHGYPSDAPQKIDTATWDAVCAAVAVIDKGLPARLPVIPHLVGGDDVLVSIPGHGAWAFTLALVTAFGAAFTGAGAPTLSAGVVIHHRSEPLSDVVDLAGTLLKAAKRGHPGRAAIGWQSITHDGPTPARRAPHSAGVWQRHWAALAALSAESASQRQELATLSRHIREGLPADELDRHLRRMGLAEIVAPFRQLGGVDLEEALGIARWWAP